jgi:Flp pilus assembly protein TadB
MDMTSLILLISFLVAVAAVIMGWEITGRWDFLSSRTQRRLQQANTPLQLEDTFALLPAASLKRRLLEAGWKVGEMQFRLGSLGLGLAGALVTWRFFLPGLPALMIGAMLAWLPWMTLKERALSRGLRIDEHLPLALSRVSAGLEANLGLADVLETVAPTLPEASPLTAELLKAAQDIRTGSDLDAMQKLAERSPSPSLANVAMLLRSFARAGGAQYAGVVSEASMQIQRVISVRNHARAKAAQALQSAKLIPLIMLGVLVMMAADPATAESFRTGTVQVVIAIAMGVMLLGFLQMRKEIRRVV